MMVVLEVADEDPVDLDLLERKGVQIRQRGIAGSKIVERDMDAEQLELAQDRYGTGEVVDQNTFGDLELEPVGFKAGLEQDRVHELGQIAVMELHRRNIHRNPERIWPRGRFLAGLAQNPLA